MSRLAKVRGCEGLHQMASGGPWSPDLANALTVGSTGQAMSPVAGEVPSSLGRSLGGKRLLIIFKGIGTPVNEGDCIAEPGATRDAFYPPQETTLNTLICERP